MDDVPSNGTAKLNRSVEKAASVLSCFSYETPTLTLAQLARLVELPKATVHRYVASLVKAGLVTPLGGGRYALGFRLFELGSVARAHLDLPATCAPAMARLAEETGETILLAMADWATGEAVILDRLDSAHALTILSPVGRRSPIRSGVLGKGLLMGLTPQDAEQAIGHLDLVPFTAHTRVDKDELLGELASFRRTGFAEERNEYLPGVSGVAVPVIFEKSRPLGVIGVIGPTSRVEAHVGRLGQQARDSTAGLRPQRSTGELVA